MKSTDDVRACFKDAGISTNPAMDKAVLTDAVRAGGFKPEKRAAHMGPSIWRFIMKTRMGKLAAAAAFLLVTALGVSLLTKSSAPVYGMTEALELIERARTLHIQGWRIDRSSSPPEEIKMRFEYWYDLENGRYRMETADRLDEEIDHHLQVCDGEYIMAEGAYKPVGDTWHKTVNFERADPNRRSDVRWLDWYRQLRRIEGFAKVGQDVIDGERLDIWQGQYDSGVGDRIDRVRLQTWLSPVTANVGRIRVWKRREDLWVQMYEYTTFERNVPLPEGIFRTEPRPGREIQTTKEAATVRVRREHDIYDGTEFGYAPLNYWVEPVFVLPGGSFLACWQGVDAKESRDQSKYFANLQVGGDLPKLPVEVYALSPEPDVRDVLFVGFHLAHTEKETEKGRRWYEWSLFVPDKEPADPNVVLVYRPHYRLNVDRTSDIDISVKQIGIPDPQKVETEAEFSRRVLSAMAQRSDDGVAPEHVTYENVLSLVEQIRASLIK